MFDRITGNNDAAPQELEEKQGELLPAPRPADVLAGADSQSNGIPGAAPDGDNRAVKNGTRAGRPNVSTLEFRHRYDLEVHKRGTDPVIFLFDLLDNTAEDTRLRMAAAFRLLDGRFARPRAPQEEEKIAGDGQLTLTWAGDA